MIQWLKNLFNSSIVSIPERRCSKCKSRHLKHGYYSSDWNNYCEQASGDIGYLCDNCHNIDFEKSFEERREIAKKHSPWVTVKR